MIEKVGNNDVLVRNYTSNFDVKEFIQDVLIPKAYPGIPISKLNLGFAGIVSEYIGQAVEDAAGTAALMMNESVITRAVLPSSIYNEASLFDIGYNFAKPSKCQFALQIWIEDIVKHSTKIRNTQRYRYRLDKNTKLILENNMYRLDYDIIIDHQFIEGRRAYNVYYDMGESNSVAITTNRHVRHQVTSIGWLVLFLELQEFDRKTEENTIADNLITTNSDIILRWNRQIAGMDLVYITPRGERLPMKKKIQHTRPEQDPFAWYTFVNENTLRLMFSNSRGYFQPVFNSKIESTIYTCTGSAANFDSYDNKNAIAVQRTGEMFEYNANTKMVALCYGGSNSGTNRGDIELLRDDIIMTYNTVKVLSTDEDLRLWFNNFAKRHNTKAYFFKRRDDPSGRLFSQFIAITDNTYVYPTNTLTLSVNKGQVDFQNDNNGKEEFIIKPGHLWEYVDDSRDTVKMVEGTNGISFVNDDAIPQINENRPFMFVNPFYIKIHKNPSVSSNYNCLINNTSWPEDIPLTNEVFYQFQLATLSIERTLSPEHDNMYHIQVICVPTITPDDSLEYIRKENVTKPTYEIPNSDHWNNLRLVLVTRSRLDGETGYIEMIPIELRKGGSVLFETYIAVKDNLRPDMMLEIDLDRTVGIKSLISSGPREDQVFIDSSETSFHFLCMMRVPGIIETPLYNDPKFNGYTMANRFSNNHRDLTLYQPMSMMRSVITFDNDNINATLVPFLKYDIALDDERMSYFVRAFNDQYAAVEPVLKRLDGNSFLDFKLINTYGKSNNYYIGPKEGSDVLWDSDILLDSVHVRIKFRMAVYDRSLYVQTCDAVINEIISFFENLSNGEFKDVHVSDLIHLIKENHPNVNYIRFLGFNEYDANKQSIFVKYDDISELRRDELLPYVPEMIRVSKDTIEIIEEV